MTGDQDLNQRLSRMESLIQAIESLPEAEPRILARETVQAILDLHRLGLAKMLALLSQSGDAGRKLRDALAGDSLIGSLFLLHGLHPVDLETRVGRALAKVEPLVRSLGCTLEPLGFSESTVRLRLNGELDGSFPLANTLRQALEEAFLETAPDVTEIAIETANSSSRLPLPLVEVPTGRP